MLQKLIDDMKTKIQRIRIPTLFREEIEKYVAKKIDSEKEKLQKQNLEYENKIKIMEAEIQKLKIQMQGKKAITGTKLAILIQRICNGNKFGNTLQKMTELTMKGKLDKVDKTLSSIKAIDDYAQRLWKRMDKSIKAKTILQNMNFFTNNGIEYQSSKKKKKKKKKKDAACLAKIT
ncbi:hypothetical protein M9Y10_002505 [Tritrichomonas musculus]|uniref:Uncharacterized protein n=1 Tax=Tritrichomonas musculus TaxID=1915356 RepID=A0ABR2LBK9_9EUKA